MTFWRFMAIAYVLLGLNSFALALWTHEWYPAAIGFQTICAFLVGILFTASEFEKEEQNPTGDQNK